MIPQIWSEGMRAGTSDLIRGYESCYLIFTLSIFIASVFHSKADW